ncbi:MAG: TolC family protein [Bacteroides sp.]|nr:TolC family protein [Bacteroides sp.]
MRILLNFFPDVVITITEEDKEYRAPETLILSELIDLALSHRADLRMAGLQISYMERSLAFERTQRIPDITMSAGYDRYGGVWKDFIGFGVSVDLPVFNRNQGAVKASRIQIEQSRFENDRYEKIVRNEAARALSDYTLAYDFYHRIAGTSLFDQLDEMLNIYTRNLLERNISMLEYIDFTETYKSNKEILLSARKKLSGGLQELQYTIGTDIK